MVDRLEEALSPTVVLVGIDVCLGSMYTDQHNQGKLLTQRCFFLIDSVYCYTPGRGKIVQCK